VSEDLRERVRVLLERIDTAAFEAGMEECEHGSAERQEQTMERCKKHKAEVLALLSAPEPAEPGADMPVRAMVEEVDHLREALYTIANYDPDEVRRSGVTPTDMRDIARNALARSLATREEMEEADTDG
jgi:hypothetical protein